MADTFIKIASTTVGAGGASSIDFTSIPSTYTDLVVKVSARSSGDVASFDYCQLRVRYNNSSTAVYSNRIVYGIASVGTGSIAGSSEAQITWGGAVTDSTATANTFSNNEIYIPNYASSANKSASHDGVSESNSTAVLTALTASLWSNTAAITQINLFPEVGSFVQYSSATLYGILKA